jgi:hypothetical protein
MQAYSSPERESDPHTLPDIEIFFANKGEWQDKNGPNDAGYYWQSCFPGCLPDSDPIGPFETEAEALADAQS